MTRPGAVLGLALAVALSGCAGSSRQDDRLAAQIKAYYADTAIEQAGACPTPEIGAITKRKILEAGSTRTVVQVRYTYYDAGIEGSAGWSSVLTSERPCTGTAERAFTLERGLAGPAVVEMSGPQRAG